jgi:hypothetical protein
VCVSRRLGRDGTDDIKAHPWFRGIVWSDLRSLPAPFVPEGSVRMHRLLRELSQVEKTAPSYRGLLRSITANFDKFDEKKAPAGPEADIIPQQPNEFIGFTYKRKKVSFML